ncbi:hypothetical protein B0H15DRAFT_946032 [Mycena belliarum]|uniref:Uncharacterized protein n=1 Tax=Mycena belliarum TaxID=1033014 RepID=A0AAD6UAR0_9AGAR|nr:hypothetical protein B0H15DRAFT_946032 [Mycena belliae]
MSDINDPPPPYTTDAPPPYVAQNPAHGAPPPYVAQNPAHGAPATGVSSTSGTAHAVHNGHHRGLARVRRLFRTVERPSKAKELEGRSALGTAINRVLIAGNLRAPLVTVAPPPLSAFRFRAARLATRPVYGYGFHGYGYGSVPMYPRRVFSSALIPVTATRVTEAMNQQQSAAQAAAAATTQ